MNGETNGTNGHHEEPVQLPSAKAYGISSNCTVQPPLSRRGHGPGLILLVPEGLDLTGHSKTLDPPPLQKWAEEGYAVAQILVSDGLDFKAALEDVRQALAKLEECDSGECMGLICKLTN